MLPCCDRVQVALAALSVVICYADRSNISTAIIPMSEQVRGPVCWIPLAGSLQRRVACAFIFRAGWPDVWSGCCHDCVDTQLQTSCWWRCTP